MIPIIPQSELAIQPIDWSGLNRRFLNPGELEVLVALVRPIAPKTMLEIGVNTGRTALALLNHVPSLERYIGVDVYEGYVPAMPVQRGEIPSRPGALAAYNPRFQLILSEAGSLDLEPRDLPPCEAVFIDGDHSRRAVLHDTALARSVIQPGGIIIWHDYHDLGTVDVRAVLDEMHNQGASLFHVEKTWLVFEQFPA